MLRLLKFLFTGTWHECKFEPVEKHQCSKWDGTYASRPSEIVHTYVSRCSECGKYSSVRVSI
jgi:hypothetical protein